MSDTDAVRGLVNQAIRTGTPAGDLVETRLYGLQEPRPLAGLQSALAVAKMAQEKAYQFAKALRGEGRSWAELADLLEIPWSEEYSRRERAYELVAGATPTTFSNRVYWTCGGPGGCGNYVTDHGPYDGHPVDTETGHADGCERLARESAAYLAAQEEAERRAEAMDAALAKITDPFGLETVKRARYVLDHGGRWLGWSTSESLAVALVLDDAEALKREGYSTKKAALARIIQGSRGAGGQSPEAWLRLLRVAATGSAK